MSADRRKSAQPAEAQVPLPKSDPQTLNRLAELLARQGRHAEAIASYRSIAEQFVQSGFLPKAAAILKKILRLDPQDRDALFLLGRLYIDQNLIGEARNYLIHATTQCIESGRFDRAREACELLIRAQPGDTRHRVRLAEVRVAEGNVDGAVNDLLAAGTALAEAGDPVEAEKLNERALGLSPQDPRALLAVVRSLCAHGRFDQARDLLDPVVRGSVAPPGSLVGELARCFVATGRLDQAETLMTDGRALDPITDAWLPVFRACVERNALDRAWAWLDRAMESDSARATAPVLLEELCVLDSRCHGPALERLLAWHAAYGEAEDLSLVLDRLRRACAGKGMQEEASAIEGRLNEFSLDGAARPSSADPAVAPALGAAAPLPFEVDVPQVPLGREEQEFAAGRLTQADVFEKYDLAAQALDQVEEVTNRFPGHVAAQERRVALLRETPDQERLGDALVRLTLAHRANGDHPAAGKAAEEAWALEALDPRAREVLQRVGLTGDAPSSSGAPPARTTSGAVFVAGSGTMVDLDSGEPTPPIVGQAPNLGPGIRSPKRTRMPNEDMLAEVRALVDAGAREEALRRLQALRDLGYSSPQLDALRDAASRGPVPAAPSAPDGAAAAPMSNTGKGPRRGSAEITVAFDDAGSGGATFGASPASGTLPSQGSEDLGSIASALDGVLFEEDAPLTSEVDEEQSFGELLANFRSQVRDEIGDQDHRAHYDLGIAYKEMGLVDEAIEEFQAATSALPLRAEACNMIALCHRERGEVDEAVRWYREALTSWSGPPNVECGLRYDLAEALLEGGHPRAALAEFRDLLRADPAFRDVRVRVADLESHDPS